MSRVIIEECYTRLQRLKIIQVRKRNYANKKKHFTSKFRQIVNVHLKLSN